MSSTEQTPELSVVRPKDELIVSYSNGRRFQEVRVQVTKVGRVWIDVEPLNGEFLPHYHKRFRRDTQSAESKGAHVYTDEQWAWKQRHTNADQYLRELGISLRMGSRYENDKLTLANIIRRGLGEDEL